MRREIGNIGESYISSWLKELGFTVEERNFYCCCTEIDIIVSTTEKEPMNKLFSFIEVKLRTDSCFGAAVYSINRRKRLNLIKAAHLWITERGYNDNQINQFYGIILDRVSSDRNRHKVKDDRRFIYITEMNSWFKVRVYNLFA